MRIKLVTNTVLSDAVKSGIPENVKIISYFDKGEYLTLFYPWPTSDKVLMLEEKLNLEAVGKLMLFSKTITNDDLVIIACRDGISISKAIADWLIDVLPTSFDVVQYLELVDKLPEFPAADELLKLKLYQISSAQISLPEVALKIIESPNAPAALKATAEEYLDGLLHLP